MNLKLRNAGKALIQKGDCILVTENRDDDGLWYILPGGGIDVGKETIIEALKRECLEETGANVTVQGLAFLRERFGEDSRGAHLFDFIFQCSVEDDYDVTLAPEGDVMQVGVKWMRIEDLKGMRFYPKVLLDHLGAIPRELKPVVYLGNVME